MRYSVYSAPIVKVLETETQMSNWNDDRLDHLEGRVDEGFKRMDGRFDKLNHTLLAGATAIVVALIGLIGALLVS
jgi:hypothetical protein